MTGFLIAVAIVFILTTSIVVIAASMNSSRISERERRDLTKSKFVK